MLWKEINVKSNSTWYALPNISTLFQQVLMLVHPVSKAATKLPVVIRSVLTDDVTFENMRIFWLVGKKCNDVSDIVTERVLKRGQFNQKHQNIDTFYSPTASNVQSIINTEKCLDPAKDCDFVFDKRSQAYGEDISCSRLLAQNFVQKRSITQKNFCNF